MLKRFSVRTVGSCYFVVLTVLSSVMGGIFVPIAPGIARAQTAHGVIFAGQPQPTSKGDVPSYVTVIGQDGYPINSLTKGAFTVTEDNAPITDFTVAPDSRPSAVVVMLDTSRRMFEKPANSSQSAMEAAKDVAKSFVGNSNQSKNLTSLITFSSGFDIAQGFTSDPLAVISKIDGIQGPPPTDGTCLYDAVYRAEEHMIANVAAVSAKSILLVTNGQDSLAGTGAPCSRKTLNDAVAKAKENGIHVYAVGIGQGVDINGMQLMTESTDGKFALADNPGQVDAEFGEIAKRMGGHYLLTYRSNADSKNHLVRIAVDAGNGLGPLTGESTFFMPPVPPRITGVRAVPAGDPPYDAVIPPDILQGKIQLIPSFDLPNRVGKVECMVSSTISQTITADAPPYLCNWDTATTLAGRDSMSVTVQLLAYDIRGNLAPDGNRSVSYSLKKGVPREQAGGLDNLVLLGIGAVAIVTLLFTVFIFLNRGRMGGAVARKPASVTKGEPLAQLIVVDGPGVTKPQEFFLYGDRSVGIGRDEDQPINLPGERVSRSHGEILYRRNQFFYNEIRATNGTEIDNQTIAKGTPVPLRDGAEIVFGGQTRTIFRLRPSGLAAAANPSFPAGASSGPPPRSLPSVPQAELHTTEWVRETPLRRVAEVTDTTGSASPTIQDSAPLQSPRADYNGKGE